MKLHVNGHQLDVTKEVQTIATLLQFLSLSSKIIIVEKNGQIIQETHYEEKIQEGDSFEIVTFVGGG